MATQTVPMIALLLLVGSFAGCMDSDENGDGTVAFYVKDAPSDDFESVFVTFTRVDVHQGGDAEDDSALNETDDMDDTNETMDDDGNETMDEGNETMDDEANETMDDDESDAGWRTIVDDETTIDLKEFQGDARAFLGDENITAGKYTQIRIYVDDVYGILASDGSRVNFTLPSGTLKIVRPWSVEAGETTVLTVDFDLDASIREAGNGQYRMQPTLKLTIEQGPTQSQAMGDDDGNSTGNTTHGNPGKGKPTSST